MTAIRYYDQLPWPLRALVRIGAGHLVIRYEQWRNR